jgi:RNA polymerase sigma factor (TIGR02999 family)
MSLVKSLIKMAETSEITTLLKAWEQGDKSALDKLMPLVYDELRRQASRYLRKERANHTLQTTDLIHEAYLKMVDQKNVSWQNRSHFFAISAKCLRQILIDYARKRHREKRGGQVEIVPIDEVQIMSAEKSLELIALHEVLKNLENQDRQKSRIVEMRYFGGLTMEEIAEVLGVSKRTVERDWQMAKAWLYKEMKKSSP